MLLEKDFYLQRHVCDIAKQMLGKVLHTHIHQKYTSGIIVETEAYNGVLDRACHAYDGRRTGRTETMYSKPGTIYVFLCYGMHHLFNIVTHAEGIPNAILIRALEPIEGIETMMKRRNLVHFSNKITSGPGNLSKAMGITKAIDGEPIFIPSHFISDEGIVVPENQIISTKRIGVDYAGEDAQLPYRFYKDGNQFVSGKV